jgi:hypothetical protein
MATNLVSQISQYLTPELVSRVAGSLGLDKTATQKATVAAVPAILTALISLVSKSQGAAKLNDAVATQEPGVLSTLTSLIGQSGQKALIDNGASTLSSLLGGKTVSGLSNALTQYAGIGQNGASSLLGLLGPVVLGFLGNEQRSSGLDASGLAKLLTSQKDAVSAALPSGISRYLGDAGILESVTAPTPRPTYQPQRSSAPSLWPWLLGALAVLAIGAWVWHSMSGRHHQVAETTDSKAAPPSAQQTGSGGAPYAGLLDKLRGVKVGDVDIGALATSAVNDLYSSATGIKDEATAQTALPGLTKATSELDQLTGLLNQLSPETRTTLAAAFASIKPNLAQLMDRVLAIPGVGAIIKPALDAINAKLDALATT